MIKFMKMLNNISRSQAIYRQKNINAPDLHGSHYALVLAICREPGRSQEELARELFINKSTVARNLNHLEEKGYVSRLPLPNNKRQLSVYPTEKTLFVLPEIRRVSADWTRLLSDGIAEDELNTFHSVLRRMQEKAKTVIEQGDDAK